MIKNKKIREWSRDVATRFFIFSFCKSQGLQSLDLYMQVVWSLHVQGLASFLGLKRSKSQVSAICTCKCDLITIECHAWPPQSIYVHYLKVILSVGLYHSSTYSHVGCKVLTQSYVFSGNHWNFKWKLQALIELDSVDHAEEETIYQ